MIEWPNKCRYWREPVVNATLNVKSMTLHDFRVRACAHGQQISAGPNIGKYPTKLWRIVTTIPNLSNKLDIPCPNDHEHAPTCGQQTALSAKYPPLMAREFHRVFAVTKPLMITEEQRSEVATFLDSLLHSNKHELEEPLPACVACLYTDYLCMSVAIRCSRTFTDHNDNISPSTSLQAHNMDMASAKAPSETW